MKRILFITFIIASISISSATIVDFKEQYQDYLGNWHSYTTSNLVSYPLYIQNGSYALRMEDTLALSIPGATYYFYPSSISLSLNYTPTQINSRSIADGVNWYIPIPESLYKTRFLWDNVKPSVSNDIGVDLDNSNYWYNKSSGQLRFYYNQTARTYGVNSQYIYFNFTTYIITNATTAGWSTSNVSTNGSRWTDDGSLAINLRNDSSLNMSGLVGYWSFDETTGTIIHNVNTESGKINSTNQGTWNGNGSLNYTSPGKIGNAGNFDGVNDYVKAGNDASLNITQAITISVWVKARSTQSQYAAIVSKEGSNSGYAIDCDITGLNCSFEVANGSKWVVSSYYSIVANNWYFITGTANSTSANTYINSALFSTIARSGSIGTNSNHILIGSNPNYLGRTFNGTIDEVQIWNRALSASEIAVLYNTSMRTQAMPVISNQTASTSTNIINSSSISFTGSDSNDNASIYVRKNGTTGWSLLQSNAVSNTWYNHPPGMRFNDMDFGIQMQGNGSQTVFFNSLSWNESKPTVSRGGIIG